MTARQIGSAALTFSTGFGIRDFLKRHKKATRVIIALVILNEIRGIVVVSTILWAWFK